MARSSDPFDKQVTTLNPIYRSFNAGEVGELYYGRDDQEKYGSALKTCINFIPQVQGPLVKRQGTRYVTDSHNNQRPWLAVYRFNASNAYILEFTGNKLRFFVNRGLLLAAPGVPLVIDTPWSEADLTLPDGSFALRMKSVNDVTWIVHAEGKFPVYKLTRFAATTWTLIPAVLINGPFDDVKSTQTISVSVSGVVNKGGSVTVTASAPIFLSGRIGSKFYMETQDPGGNIVVWTADVDRGDLGYRRNEGNVYKNVSPEPLSDKNGVHPPVHVRGRASDGKQLWEYWHSQRAHGTITAVAPDGLSCTLLMDTPTFPEIVTPVTTRWAFSLFNVFNGYPTDVTFFLNRLCYLQKNFVICSTIGDYDNFSRFDGPSVTDKTSVILRVDLEAAGSSVWFQEMAQILLIGTTDNEGLIRQLSDQKAFASDNARADPQTTIGSTYVKPVKMQDSLMVVQRNYKAVSELVFSLERGQYQSQNLNVLAHHILKEKVIQTDKLSYPQEQTQLCCLVKDGAVAAMIYVPIHKVAAWTRYQFADAEVKSIACIPSPQNDQDDLWLACKRTINGLVRYHIEYVGDPIQEDEVLADGVYLDSALTYSGTPTTTLNGLGHLEGKTVSILADGAIVPPKTVSSGGITLNYPASKVTVGLPYTAKMQTMPLNAGGQGMLMSGQGHEITIGSVSFRLKESYGGEFGPVDDVEFLTPIPYNNVYGSGGVTLTKVTGDIMDVSCPILTYDGSLVIKHSEPFPFTLTALMYKANVNR